MSAQGALPDGRDDFGLIETLLWTSESGFWLVEGHRARMAASASALGFAFAPDAFDAALAQAWAGTQAQALRVRLVLRPRRFFAGIRHALYAGAARKNLARRFRARALRFARSAVAPQDHAPRAL